MDFIKQFVLKTIAFKYNQYSHYLFIEGRDTTISLDMAARVQVDMDETNLFEAEIFHRYVAAQIRLVGARAFSIVKMKALGGGSIDWTEIKEIAKSDLADVKQIMSDDDSGAAFLMIDGQMVD